ncbi:MAG: hypothetical protein AB1330_06925 [Bacillota bacterium]
MNHRQRYRYLRSVKGYDSEQYFKETKAFNQAAHVLEKQHRLMLELREALLDLNHALTTLNRHLKRAKWFLH